MIMYYLLVAITKWAIKIYRPMAIRDSKGGYKEKES